MPGPVASELRTKMSAAQTNLFRQLDGLEPHLDKSDAPGQWTAREVLSHLLFAPRFDPVATLETFHATILPLIEISPGDTHLDGARKAMSRAQFQAALAKQQGSVLAYVQSVPDAELGSRKARIPLFKQFMQTEEVSIAMYVGALFDYHWNDHTGQLGKIRKAAGLPDAK